MCNIFSDLCEFSRDDRNNSCFSVTEEDSVFYNCLDIFIGFGCFKNYQKSRECIRVFSRL